MEGVKERERYWEIMESSQSNWPVFTAMIFAPVGEKLMATEKLRSKTGQLSL